MANLQGFWSYVHANDQADNGRISQLARHVKDQFEMLTSDRLELFLDRNELKWGENWRDKIASSLASVAFFIPVITPRYFTSVECRRRGATQLAKRLVEVNRHAEEVDVTAKALQSGETPDGHIDDSTGFLDQLARAEETLPTWRETVEAVGREIELIGQVMQDAAADISRSNAAGKGFSSRLLIAREVARLLVGPAVRIQSFGNEYASQLHDVDEGIRAIIERAPAEIQTNPDSKAEVCVFFNSVRYLSEAASKALENVRGMIEAIAPIEKMSRDMRPTLRQLQQGLTIMVEAGEVSDEWIRLIDDSGIRCEDQAMEQTNTATSSIQPPR